MKSERRARNTSNNKVILILVRLVSVANMLVFIFSTDKFYNLTIFSLAARLLLMSNLLIFIYVAVRRRLPIRVFSSLALLLAMAGSAYISYSLNPLGGIGDFLISLSSYLAVPIYMAAIPELRETEGMIPWLKCMAWGYALVFVVMSVVFPSYRIGTGALMLGYSNSNATGAYLFLVIMLLVLLYQKEKRKIVKGAVIAIECTLLSFIIATQSRTAFLLAAAAILYDVLPYTLRLTKRFSTILVFLPAVFSVLYLWVYRKGLLADATILGKPIFSGRQYGFAETQPLTLFGQYANGAFGGLNVYLAVSTTVGLIGTVLWWIVYTRFVSLDFLDRSDTRSNKGLSRFCFCLLLLHGCTEACIFTGGTVFAGMVGIILIAIAANGNGADVSWEKGVRHSR